MQTNHKSLLLSLIREKALIPGEFILSSGAVRNHYVDIKALSMFSEGSYLIGEVLYQATKDLNFGSIGGMAIGSIPITTAALISYKNHNSMMHGFWIRDKEKDHGMKRLVEGVVIPGDSVVIVDDVITTGQSALKAYDAMIEMGCMVVGVVGLVDRLEGASELFKEKDIEYRAIYRLDGIVGK